MSSPTIINQAFTAFPYINQLESGNADTIAYYKQVLNGKNIAVIGAGFAGLSAAYYLTIAGATVTIYEKTDRFGGRVKSVSQGHNVDPGNDTNFPNGRIIEGGAELIGANHLLWLYYAKRFSLGLATLTGETDYDQAGLAIENDLGITMDSAFEQDLAAVYTAFANDADKYITDPYNPWTAQAPYATVQDAIKAYSTNADVLTFLDFELHNNNVTPIDQQSYLGLLIAVKAHAVNSLNYFDDHETFRCASGNQSLAVAFQEGQNLITTPPAEVTAIGVEGTQLSVTVNDKPYPYDGVVLAVPATAYPNINVTGLSGGKTLSDYQVSSGHAVKFLTAVTDRFWLANDQAPTGAFSALGMVWENTDQQYQQAFTSGTGSVNQYGLSVFAGGSTADSLVNLANQGNDAVKTALANKFPVAAGSSDKGFADSNVWTQQEFWEDQGNFIGYSCPVNNGSSDEASSVWANIAGLNRDFANGLFLAGENTSPGFFGYMEGALQSGVQAAQQVIDQAAQQNLPFSTPYLDSDTTVPNAVSAIEVSGVVYMCYRTANSRIHIAHSTTPSDPDSWIHGAINDSCNTARCPSLCFDDQTETAYIVYRGSGGDDQVWITGNADFLNNPIKGWGNAYLPNNTITSGLQMHTRDSPQMVIFNGQFCIVYRGSGDGMFILSTKDPLNITAGAAAMSSGGVGIKPSNGPSLIVDGDTLYLFFTDTADSTTGSIYTVQCSGDPQVATNWSNPTRLPGTAYADGSSSNTNDYGVSVALHNGIYYLSFLQPNGSTNQVATMLSLDLETWTQPQLINQNGSDGVVATNTPFALSSENEARLLLFAVDANNSLNLYCKMV